MLSEKQDLMPQGRCNDAMLAHLLGADCGCGTAGEPESGVGPYVDARMDRGTCGLCDGRPDGDMSVCGFGVEGGVAASVYAPMQRFEGVYDLTTAMRRGTMFEALDKPFYGDGREVDCHGRER